jgi:hypothetical protein
MKSRMKSFLFLALGGILLFALAIASPLKKEEATKHATVKIGDVSLSVELARTAEEKVKGLSGRNALPENQGMLFVFDKPDFYSFWMKDMHFPIDIIWLNVEGRVIDLTLNASPDSFPKIFQPQIPAHYVLEVNAGSVQKYRVQLKDEITLPPFFSDLQTIAE